jgi:uncharacterized protein HemX
MEIETKLKINQRIFAVVLVIVIMIASYLFYQQEQLHSQQQQWQDQLSSLQTNFQHWQNNQLKSESSALNTVRALIIQANINLQSKQNSLLILNLLKTAQQQLIPFHDAKVVLLQQALQTDIATLQQIPVVNLANIAHSINFINEKIATLKFLELKATTIDVHKTATSDNWHTLRTALKQVISVQHIDGSVTPIVSDDQKIAVQQYLRELLQQCWWAATQHDNILYQAGLKNIVITLDHYVMNGTKNLEPSLADLQKINVTQTWPSQLYSVTALQQLLDDLTPNEKPL